MSHLMLPLLLAALLAVFNPASGIVVPLGVDADALPARTLVDACVGQGARAVCFPAPTGSRRYIQCGANGTAPRRRSCPTGRVFDYVNRSCMRRADARTCPFWNVPAVGGGPALGPFIGQIGVVGNATIPLTKEETFTIVCPIHGHGLGGMIFNVHVECPAPQHRTPYTFYVNFNETVWNGPEHDYPRRLADLSGYCGDSIFIEWVDPIHAVQVFNTSRDAVRQWYQTPVYPYPPQPVYRCPEWPMQPDLEPIPLEGDQVLMPFFVGAQNVTWNATAPETFFFVCPLTNHCRLGQVFKTTVRAAPANYTAMHYNISWLITGDLFPDMHLSVGDSVTFSVPAFPPMAHLLYKVPASRIVELP